MSIYFRLDQSINFVDNFKKDRLDILSDQEISLFKRYKTSFLIQLKISLKRSKEVLDYNIHNKK